MRQTGRETTMCGCPWPTTQTCTPDWESNRPPFGSQACAQSIELHQPGPPSCLLRRESMARVCHPHMAGETEDACMCTALPSVARTRNWHLSPGAPACSAETPAPWPRAAAQGTMGRLREATWPSVPFGRGECDAIAGCSREDERRDPGVCNSAPAWHRPCAELCHRPCQMPGGTRTYVR